MNVKFLSVIVFAFLATKSAALASQSNPDGIVRMGDGYVLHTDSRDSANFFCRNGTHLPTARDWAKFGQENGAKGIMEVSEVGDGQIPAGYQKIVVTNPGGQRDEFYYNEQGYKAPSDDFRREWFWSISVSANRFQPTFSGDTGKIVTDAPRFFNNLGAHRCF